MSETKTMAITGSASGIGAATRSILESQDHKIIGIDLRDAEIIADLSTPQGRDMAISELTQKCEGRLDGLVTAAGIGQPNDPAKILSLNYFGTVAFLDQLRGLLAAADGVSKAVAISSNSTTTVPGIPQELVDACLEGDETGALTLLDSYSENAQNFAYAGGKTAVAHYVRRNAPTENWAGSGIRLNAIAPGATLTPLLQAGLDSEEFGPLIENFPVPTGGFGTAQQIATWICHMLSDDADFLCGSVIFVDGGTDALVRPDSWPKTYEM